MAQLNASNKLAPVVERSLLPYEIFKIFLANTKMVKICVETTNYICLKGNHMFTMTLEKLKAFLTILLVSGYAELPRQEIYWKIRGACHKLVVSAMMTKTKFLECKQYLHLADNNALNISDKFVKVRSLFNTINKNCILN